LQSSTVYNVTDLDDIPLNSQNNSNDLPSNLRGPTQRYLSIKDLVIQDETTRRNFNNNNNNDDDDDDSNNNNIYAGNDGNNNYRRQDPSNLNRTYEEYELKKTIKRKNYKILFVIDNKYDEKSIIKYLEGNCKYFILTKLENEHHLKCFLSLNLQTRVQTVRDDLKKPRYGFNGTTIFYNARIDPSRNKRDILAQCRGKKNIIREFGNIENAKQGKRNDVHNVAWKIKDNYDLEQIVEENTETFIKFSSGISKAHSIYNMSNNKVDFRKINVILLYGHAGTGKTRYCIDWCLKHKKEYFQLSEQENGKLWWDGYNKQQVLICDDFTKNNWIPIKSLLKILDIYHKILDIKFSKGVAQWDTIFITSNFHFNQWYPGIPPETLEALERRIHKIFHFFWNDKKTKEKVIIKCYKNDKPPDIENKKSSAITNIEDQPIRSIKAIEHQAGINLNKKKKKSKKSKKKNNNNDDDNNDEDDDNNANNIDIHNDFDL